MLVFKFLFRSSTVREYLLDKIANTSTNDTLASWHICQPKSLLQHFGKFITLANISILDNVIIVSLCVPFVEDKPHHNQQPAESLMKTYALNTNDINPSPNTVNNSSPSLKPRNMPIRAIIPPGKSTSVNNDDSRHHGKEATPPDDDLQKRATPPLEYAQKGPSQSPSPDYYEQQEQYNRTGAIQVSNLRKSPVFPRRVIQPAQVIPSPQQQQHKQQLPQPSKSVSPKASPIMSRRVAHEPSGLIKPPQGGGGSMLSRLSPGRTMGGSIKAPATGMNKSNHSPPGGLQHQQQQPQHLQGNIARPMGKPLAKQPSPLQPRKQLMVPGQSSKAAFNHHQQQRPATHRLGNMC